MTIIWQVRIAIARFFLGTGPDGYHYCFRGRTLFVRAGHSGAASVKALENTYIDIDATERLQP